MRNVTKLIVDGRRRKEPEAWRRDLAFLAIIASGPMLSGCDGFMLAGALIGCAITNPSPAWTLPEAIPLRDSIDFKTKNGVHVRLTHFGVKTSTDNACEANAVVTMTEEAAERFDRLSTKERVRLPRGDTEDAVRFVVARVGSNCNVQRVGLATDLGTWPRPKAVGSPRVFTIAPDGGWQPVPIACVAP